MSLTGPNISFEDSLLLPPAYGGCTCSCHREPNCVHVAPCCYPKDEGEGNTLIEAWRRSSEENKVEKRREKQVTSNLQTSSSFTAAAWELVPKSVPVPFDCVQVKVHKDNQVEVVLLNKGVAMWRNTVNMLPGDTFNIGSIKGEGSIKIRNEVEGAGD